MTISDESANEVTDKGLAIYDTKLRDILEPTHSNEYVVIHVDSGDYALGKKFSKALRAIRQRHEPGRLVGRRIGNESEYGLAARILASQSASVVQKRSTAVFATIFRISL
jgi:hypothetical protein